MTIQDVAIIIPSRLNSTRLHQKPLTLIGDMSMIEHVYLKAKMLEVDATYVATDSEEIADVIVSAGGKCIMTPSDCPSGTDRIHLALQSIQGKHKIKYVLNLQGDMPFIDIGVLQKVIETLRTSGADIVTPVAKVGLDVAQSHSNVKVVIDKNDTALYFSRAMIPHGAEHFWYHIGIYGFTVDALQKITELPYSYLEKTESLEQLRALENGMKISVCYAEIAPTSVDTPDDLEKARAEYARLD